MHGWVPGYPTSRAIVLYRDDDGCTVLDLAMNSTVLHVSDVQSMVQMVSCRVSVNTDCSVLYDSTTTIDRSSTCYVPEVQYHIVLYTILLLVQYIVLYTVAGSVY